MNFSKLNKRIIIFKPSSNFKNSMGENIPVWIPFFVVDEKDCQFYIEINENGIESINGNQDEADHKYGVWAYVAPVSGREYLENMKIRDETTYKISCRYIPDVHADMKILYKNRVFNIISVLNFGERNRELQFICTEVDVNGKQ